MGDQESRELMLRGTLSAIRESVEHWERMIAWVEEQERKRRKPSASVMANAIGETWGETDCSLCARFRRNDCIDCPLGMYYSSCICIWECDGNTNAYCSVAKSKTWLTWLKRARVMLEQLRDTEVRFQAETRGARRW